MIDGFYIGNFKIYFYGIIIMVGVLVAVFISSRRAKLYGQDETQIWDMLPWLLVAGLIGARIWHVLTPSRSLGVTASYYFSHPIEIFNIRQGGLGIPGAVMGGVIGLWFFTQKNGGSMLIWADIIAPGLALAQAIGRWGNFVNQELYGPPTDLPWGIFIEASKRLPGFEGYTHFHPMFLYESLWNIVNFLILYIVSKSEDQRKRSGELFFLFILIYSIGRFFLELIRLDASYVARVNANQVTMLAAGMLSAAMIISKRRRKRETKLE